MNFFLFLLKLGPWDYQELSNLLHFADDTMRESEAAVGNFNFLTLKNGSLCLNPWGFFS